MHNNKIRHYIQANTLMLLLVLIATVVLYLPGLNGPFLLDDYTNTLQLKMNTLNWERLLPLSFSQENGPLGRPIANASFSLNFIFFGADTLSFKITNLILHLITGILLFILSKKILTHCMLWKLKEKQITSIALITTTLWLLHPLHISTVLYVVQRMTQLSTLFTLLAVLSYIYGRERIIQEKRFAYSTMLLGYFTFGMLGMFSKETTALLPGYILLIEIIIFKFRTTAKQARVFDRKFFVTFCIIAVIPIVIGISFFFLKQDVLLASYMNRDFSLSERLVTESLVLWDYVSQCFSPQLSNMALHQDGYPISTSLNAYTLFAIAGLLGLTLIGLLLRKKEPIIALGILWFLLSHTLESTVLPLEIKFEHRNYLAMYGLLLASVYGIYRFTMFTQFSILAKVLLGLYVTLLSYQTYNRATIWADQETLYKFEATFQPNSYRLNNALLNTELRHQNFSAARNYNLQLRKIRPWDAGPALQDIMIDCIEMANSNEIKNINSVRYIDESLALIAKSAYLGSMPYSLINLNQIVTTGRCTNINTQTMIKILNTATAHPRAKEQPLLQQKLIVQVARLHVLIGRIKMATNSLKEAHRLKPERLNTLLEKGYIELNTGDLNEAKKTIIQLKELNDTLPFYRKYTTQVTELASFIQQEEMTQQRK